MDSSLIVGDRHSLAPDAYLQNVPWSPPDRPHPVWDQRPVGCLSLSPLQHPCWSPTSSLNGHSSRRSSTTTASDLNHCLDGLTEEQARRSL